MDSSLQILSPNFPAENLLNVFKLVFFHSSTVLRSTTLSVSEKLISEAGKQCQICLGLKIVLCALTLIQETWIKLFKEKDWAASIPSDLSPHTSPLSAPRVFCYFPFSPESLSSCPIPCARKLTPPPCQTIIMLLNLFPPFKILFLSSCTCTFLFPSCVCVLEPPLLRLPCSSSLSVSYLQIAWKVL